MWQVCILTVPALLRSQMSIFTQMREPYLAQPLPVHTLTQRSHQAPIRATSILCCRPAAHLQRELTGSRYRLGWTFPLADSGAGSIDRPPPIRRLPGKIRVTALDLAAQRGRGGEHLVVSIL